MAEDTSSIFISYASPDRERVLEYFDWLKKNGFNVWMDCRSIKAGQNWDFEIKRGLDKATFILMFISNISYDRRGYIQREIKLALDKLNEKLIDDIYIIPVLLDDDAKVPDQLKGIQYISASNSQSFSQIADALQHQLERLGIEKAEIQEKEQVYWTSRIKKEEWEGLPGYEVELQFLDFNSDIYPNVKEIGEYIKGNLLLPLFRHREERFSQSPESLNYGQHKFRRTSTYDAHCEEPMIVGKMISVVYTIDWYGAGAAHPNHHFDTYNFFLEPIVLVESLEHIFTDSKNAFKTIQIEVRELLYNIKSDNEEASEDSDSGLPKEWIDEGTKEWKDFHSFAFKSDGIEILFPPYQVSCYADGSHSVVIPYPKIIKLLKNEFISYLNIEYLDKSI